MAETILMINGMWGRDGIGRIYQGVAPSSPEQTHLRILMAGLGLETLDKWGKE